MRPNGPYPNGQNPYMNHGQYPPNRPTMNGQAYNQFNSSPTQNNFQVSGKAEKWCLKIDTVESIVFMAKDWISL